MQTGINRFGNNQHITQLVRSEVPEYTKNSILVESGQHIIAYLIKG